MSKNNPHRKTKIPEATASFRKKPIASAILQHRHTLLATALLLPTSVLAAGGTLEEVVVTAQKRTADLQDTSISLQVLGNEMISELGIKDFGDYMQYLPSVSYDYSRPGMAQVFMRGIVSGNNGNHSASQPSVSVYLDEQPITTINEILDIQAYDLARIETLSGPQGTLFGTSSQSGTLRIITNKPVIGEFEAGYDIGGSIIDGGDGGYTGEGFVNIPINDKAAIRLVAWHDKVGGYVDNVPSTITFAASGITVDNAQFVEKNFNDSEKTGIRAKLKVDLNDNWTINPGFIYQKQNSNGTFDHDPETLGDLQAQEFFDTFFDEEWYQASLTIEGKIGNLDVVYAGAYLDRDRDSQYDYTGYAEYLEELYAGYGYACYLYQADGSCTNPSQFVAQDENWNRHSHEIRIQNAQDQRLRYVTGLFYQDAEHDFDLQWIPVNLNPADSVIEGGGTVWLTKQIRQDEEKAVFGEISFDINDKLTVLGGARYFWYDNKLFGFNGFIGHCTGSFINGVFVEDQVNGTPQFPCFDTRILDGQKKNNDVIFKANISYKFNDDVMVYATYSEGYRAGGVNRARVAGIPGYDEDFTENYEIGWKTTWLDNRIRFNGAAYHIDWDNFQFSILDFTVSNLTIINNAGAASVNGFEIDSEFAATEELNLSFSASYNDAELDEDLVSGFVDVQAAKGSSLPFTPKLQTTLIGRYETNVGEFGAFGQAAWSYTGDSWSDLNTSIRQKQDSYHLLNLSAGFSKDNWHVDLFLHNATDERPQIARLDPGYPNDKDTTTNTNRPRMFGIRFGQKF